MAAADTLESCCEVWVVDSRVLELHMLVGPPGDACSRQRNRDLCAVGIVVKKLQCVCHTKKDRLEIIP